ncbi:hypothetical protein [Microbispora siamensis]|uniref:GIY-YIG domain-containing protein n=1 Tax=Microbispora siamensis TaxID=564413 RepID=A0ABQ4GZZ6_9ACTN|nr:hypothetical protein [Microbispora siamensis]GIH66988.1 hypothetical protein Msi02_78050 [Microbispora siamensis]
MTDVQRRADTDRFYGLLETLAARTRLPRLRECSAADSWPAHGVYFFFEDGETRTEGNRPRVVRVGTHALTERSRTQLWTRLRQHRGNVGGTNPGGGNHRGSIFRLHVGTALLNSGEWPAVVRAGWRLPRAGAEVRLAQHELERAVSDHIGAMRLLCLPAPEREQRRAIESNAIALLSLIRGGVDPPSPRWLGRHAESLAVRTSGLWNVQHVDGRYDRAFLDLLGDLVEG